jgi:hypothetical protein
VNPAGKTVIATGLALLAVTMFYGVGYAVFDEHQTLVGMGESMAAGFLEAAAENLPAAFESLDAYGALSQEYRNEVHAHGHWGMLSLILIVLGLVFGRIAFAEHARKVLAWILALSAALFPLGVLLQNGPAAGLGRVLSLLGSVGMILGLLAVVYGLLKRAN